MTPFVLAYKEINKSCFSMQNVSNTFDSLGLCRFWISREESEPRKTCLPCRSTTTNMKPGDWHCPTCNYLCYASRDSCPRCRTPAPERNSNHSGVQARRLPGDWDCDRCRFHNYAFRPQCMKCGALKQNSLSNSSSSSFENDLI